MTIREARHVYMRRRRIPVATICAVDNGGSVRCRAGCDLPAYTLTVYQLGLDSRFDPRHVRPRQEGEGARDLVYSASPTFYLVTLHQVRHTRTIYAPSPPLPFSIPILTGLRVYTCVGTHPVRDSGG